MALAYLAGWKGPVSEEEDPYDDGMTNPDAKPVLHLQQARYLSNDRDAVKKAVLGDGAVESEMYADPSFLAGDAGSVFYDPDTFSYYYQGSETANHEILIVGWDDSFAADNFAIKAPDDGAFICQNSWGTDFADGGYFYISYYDSCILKRPLCFDRLDPIGTYDQIYQQDLLGHTANAGFGGPEAWGTCLYTAQSDQTLKAVSFYTTGRDTSFEIYTAEEPDSSFSKRIMQAEGTRTYEGYYTVELARPVTLQKGERFAILLKVDCPGSFKPLAVETDVEEAVSQRQMGTSFMSNDGKFIIEAGEYDSISLLDEENMLYLVEKNNEFGVLNRDGEIIIYAENDGIGYDVSNYTLEKLDNKLLWFGKCIPVMKDGKYGLYSKDGENELLLPKEPPLTYEGFGYLSKASSKTSGNEQSVLIIPGSVGIEGIVIKYNDLYGIYDVNEERIILTCVFSKIYAITKNAKTTYYVEYGGNTYNLSDYLEENNLKNIDSNGNYINAPDYNSNQEDSATEKIEEQDDNNTLENTSSENDIQEELYEKKATKLKNE